MPLAISCKSQVLPALGGATIIVLWPFPTGEIRSIIRVERTFGSVSSFIHSSGKIGVSLLKSGLFLAFSGSALLTFSTLRRERYLSPSFGGLAWPLITSPPLKLNLRIWERL